MNDTKKYIVGAEVNYKWVKEVFDARYPQEAIDKFKEKHGQIYITSGHNFYTKEATAYDLKRLRRTYDEQCRL